MSNAVCAYHELQLHPYDDSQRVLLAAFEGTEGFPRNCYADKTLVQIVWLDNLGVGYCFPGKSLHLLETHLHAFESGHVSQVTKTFNA